MTRPPRKTADDTKEGITVENLKFKLFKLGVSAGSLIVLAEALGATRRF